ncbi:hypothetical protein BSM4216_0710 [Bacillus smithii]|nr:hypothetical protein BSM4216_0710 [Bacillus smithii]
MVHPCWDFSLTTGSIGVYVCLFAPLANKKGEQTPVVFRELDRIGIVTND